MISLLLAAPSLHFSFYVTKTAVCYTLDTFLSSVSTAVWRVLCEPRVLPILNSRDGTIFGGISICVDTLSIRPKYSSNLANYKQFICTFLLSAQLTV